MFNNSIHEIDRRVFLLDSFIKFLNPLFGFPI